MEGLPWASPGNILHDTTELLRSPGGGEPGHLGLQQLPASLSPEDEAVPGSAGLGSDDRNRTEVREEPSARHPSF